MDLVKGNELGDLCSANGSIILRVRYSTKVVQTLMNPLGNNNIKIWNYSSTLNLLAIRLLEFS
jgi:hypothetical protein